MKITGLRTYKFSVPTGQGVGDLATGEMLSSSAKPWLFLRIDTDAGITGWGEGTGEWLVPSVEATLHDWAVLLVDRDPLPVASICEDVLDRIPWRPGPVFGTALAAINAALYDIAGKSWGVPVHTILGGARRQRVRVYGHCSLDDPGSAAEEALRVRDLGFAGVKGNPLETRTWLMDGAAIEQSCSAWRPCARPRATTSICCWTPTAARAPSSASSTPGAWSPMDRCFWRSR